MTAVTESRTARVTLGGLAALGVVGILWGPPAPRVPHLFEGEPNTDVAAFRVVVERLRAGDLYYEAFGDVLRARHYPTGSVFNWRTPLHLTLVASAPWWVWRAVMSAISIAFFATAMSTMSGDRTTRLAGAILLAGVVVSEAAWDAVYSSEVWAGLLIGLSICAYAHRRWLTAVVFGLMALFVRELSLPYCLSCATIAAVRRQRRELAVWAGGGLSYLVYFAWHWTHVDAARRVGDLAQPASWVQLGGLPFLQATLTKVSWFAFLPTRASTAVVVLLAAGALSQLPLHVRVTGLVLASTFLVVGLPFNDYWGWVAAPAWAMACAYGPGVIGRAIERAGRA